MKTRSVLLKLRNLRWPALFSFLALTFYPLPLLSEEAPLESVSYRLREKPIEVPSGKAFSDSASQKVFKTAFITLTNDEEAPLDTLDETQKINRFKDSFSRFFNEMARKLGNLLFPRGESVGTAAIGASAPLASGMTSQSSFDDPHPFEPIDLNSLHPVDFGQRLTRLLPESYSFETLRNTLLPFSSLTSTLSLPGRGVGEGVFFLRPLLEHLPQLATSSVISIPSILTDAFKLETPLLLSELRDQNLKSLREAFPNSNASPLPLLQSSLPLLVDPETFPSAEPRSLPQAPSPSFAGQGPAPRANPLPPGNPAPSVNPISTRGGPAPSFGGRNPHSPSYPPLIWDALRSLSGNKREESGLKKPRVLTPTRTKKKKDIYSQGQRTIHRTFLISPSLLLSPQLALARVVAKVIAAIHPESIRVSSLSRYPPFSEMVNSLPHSRGRRLS